LLVIATLTSLLLIVLAILDIAPVQSQIINLPESLQAPPTTNTTEVGNLDVGKIRLDGKVLFRVAVPTPTAPSSSTSTSPIEQRVKTIQFHLSDIVKRGFDPNTLQITPSSLNNQTVLVASDKNWGPRYILTVTPLDVELDEPGTIDEVAQRWSKLIEQALFQAREQRQPTYQKQQIPVVLAILTAMVAGSFGIRRLQKFRGSIRRKLEQRQRELEATETNFTESISSSTPRNEASLASPTEQARSGFSRYVPQLTLDQRIGINLIMRQLLFSTQFAIWFGGMAIIFHRFPQTRALGDWLLRVPLAYLAVPLGMTLLKSVIDVWLQSHVKRIVDRIKEKGGGDVRLRPRALSISSVLEELSGYLVVGVGFLLFFYIINELQIALIALAAIAFLSQNLLQDFVKTYFILAQDQYALGDWIQIGEVNGRVEKISLRNSQVRAACGDLFTIAHGSFTQVTNFTHRYSGINLWIDVAYSTDLDRAIAIIEQVAKEMQQDSVWGQYITALDMKGVEKFGDNSITIRLIIMAEAGEQWRVGREYRRRLKPAFDQAGISIPFPQRSIWFKNFLQTTNEN
jgi:small conductance mechanosensitive channel